MTCSVGRVDFRTLQDNCPAHDRTAARDSRDASRYSGMRILPQSTGWEIPEAKARGQHKDLSLHGEPIVSEFNRSMVSARLALWQARVGPLLTVLVGAWIVVESAPRAHIRGAPT